MNASKRSEGISTESTSSSSGGVQSVDRAIALLEILAREGSAGVSEAAAEIGVHKSTAFRLLTALEEHDFVEQTVERGKYQLGFGVLRIAAAVPGRLDLIRQCAPVLDDLAARIDETVNLAVLREGYSVHVHQVLGSSAVASQNWVGQLTPVHATSSGKVLLTSLSTAELGDVVSARGLARCTERTITDLTSLRNEIAAVRDRGFATAFGELEDGLNAAAVPVWDHSGMVVAALSVSGPAFRFDENRLLEAVPAMLAAGAHLSQRMGWIDRGAD